VTSCRRRGCRVPDQQRKKEKKEKKERKENKKTKKAQAAVRRSKKNHLRYDLSFLVLTRRSQEIRYHPG
jgi:hypothetical protein